MGHYDLHNRNERPLATRSFVFTYTGSEQKAPVTADRQVAGRSTIHEYVGPAADWDVKNKLANQWPLKPVDFDPSLWK